MMALSSVMVTCFALSTAVATCCWCCNATLRVGKKKTVINIRRIIYVGIAVSEFIRVMKKKKPIKYKCKNINGVTHLLRKKRHYLCDDGVQTLRDFRLDKKKKSQLCRYALTCTYYPYIRRMCCKNTGVTIY